MARFTELPLEILYMIISNIYLSAEEEVIQLIGEKRFKRGGHNHIISYVPFCPVHEQRLYTVARNVRAERYGFTNRSAYDGDCRCDLRCDGKGTKVSSTTKDAFLECKRRRAEAAHKEFRKQWREEVLRDHPILADVLLSDESDESDE